MNRIAFFLPRKVGGIKRWFSVAEAVGSWEIDPTIVSCSRLGCGRMQRDMVGFEVGFDGPLGRRGRTVESQDGQVADPSRDPMVQKPTRPTQRLASSNVLVPDESIAGWQDVGSSHGRRKRTTGLEIES